MTNDPKLTKSQVTVLRRMETMNLRSQFGEAIWWLEGAHFHDVKVACALCVSLRDFGMIEIEETGVVFPYYWLTDRAREYLKENDDEI